MKVQSDPRVKEIFKSYPKQVKHQLNQLRMLVLEVAKETDGLDHLEETLKWGEPSYLTKYGSTLRMDWKPKAPEQYAMYFKCTSKLVETFRKIFGNTFKYEKNRAIIFNLDDDIPIEQLKQCIAMTLTYHNIKHLPQLGNSKD